MAKNKNSKAKPILPISYQKKCIAIGKIKITFKGGGKRSQQLFEWIFSTLSNWLFIIVESPVILLEEHPSSCMSCRFIWLSMDAHPTIGLVNIVDWKLRMATLWSGNWWIWFIETFRSAPIWLVAFDMPGHFDVSL